MHPKKILLGVVAAAMTLGIGGGTADAANSAPPLVREIQRAEITDVYTFQPYVVGPGSTFGGFTLFGNSDAPVVRRCLGEPLPFQSDNERRDAIGTGGGVPATPGVC